MLSSNLFLTILIISLQLFMVKTELYNVAVYKKAYQINNYSGCQCLAGKAVDGDTNGNHPNCAIVNTNTGWMWWMVDLGQNYSIRIVQLYNRIDGYSEIFLTTKLMFNKKINNYVTTLMF